MTLLIGDWDAQMIPYDLGNLHILPTMAINYYHLGGVFFWDGEYLNIYC